MALALTDLRIRRTALLLRCQQAREDRQRFSLLEAERAQVAAATDLEAARAALLAQAARSEQTTSSAHEKLRGLVVGPGDIERLAALEHDLARETADIAERLRAAEDRVARMRAAATEARAALQAQARATAKRSRLARELANRQRIERESAEEAERDEQRVDTWRSL